MKRERKTEADYYIPLLICMSDISQRMNEEIYLHEFDHLGPQNKYILSLFDEAFRSIDLFCDGMSMGILIQNGMILRLLIEQASIIKCLCREPKLLPAFIHHHKFRKSIYMLSKSKQIAAIKKEFNLGKDEKAPFQFLDYGWLGDEAIKAKNKEDYLISRAGYRDCLAWKKMYLDKFAHQSFTFVDFVDDERREELQRAFMEISCKMFDEICCLFHSLTGFEFVWDGISKFQDYFRPAYADFVAYLDKKQRTSHSD